MMFVDVQLYTNGGLHVATVLMPPFSESQKPDVLVWGDRHFKQGPMGGYYECFAVVVFTRDEFRDIVVSGGVT
jgi:hypothetical protein